MVKLIIEVDIAVIGSGLSAIKAVSIFYNLGKKIIMIDSQTSEGGVLQSINGGLKLTKVPILIDQDLVQKINIDEARCFNVERIILKEGNIMAKILGYSNIAVEKTWIDKWLSRDNQCYSPNIYSSIKKYLGISEKGLYLISNIRGINIDRQLIALSNGLLVKYKKLIYTWPLDIIDTYIFSTKEDIKRTVREKIRDLLLKNISMYISLFVYSSNIEGQNLVIYQHGTKASKFHTAVKFPFYNHSILYLITSFSKDYTLIAGIGEKLLSEARRYRLIDVKRIVKRHDIVITYALLNKVDNRKITELREYLLEKNLILYGRCALWKDLEISEILVDRSLEQYI
ncbi:hypothetical protein Igag_0089 [Ignisphaera aggregans DSM 17230]|uniref:FAD-binding protein n=1 Tax=Ignisphaera aggregans (strain DSM 17230 / JCM 13409 / AQ1.S1) TaxID=583356 RepID=E0SPJ8_IGNAA|nr:hypothetical protein Igag_0089 [Ignisphaera aggregans DSM 17230]